VPSGGYLWWYIDALSDDSQHGLTIIAFVGSVFSPYYAWARSRSPDGLADPENHCALNVALYGQGGSHWSMTERGRSAIHRSPHEYRIGRSRMAWEAGGLTIDIDEVTSPIPRRVRGRVRLHTEGVCSFLTALDAAGHHQWGPIAPCARVEVEFDQPGLRWSGRAYMDANQGSEPVERAFQEWDWARSEMADGSTAVIYDVRPLPGLGPDRVIAQCFAPDGSNRPFTAPARQRLPRSAWGIARTMRSDADVVPQVTQSLEDTPFYARAVLSAGVLGEKVTAMHETLNVPRLVSWPVRLMLPWRMPRRG
jgi:carotenoid 1,2-hydratase